MGHPKSMEDARQVLQETFGFSDFRSLQEAVIERALRGENALVILPTGMGKSLCYQLPSQLLDGLTLVVSPLIALMDDQVAAAQAKGLMAGAIHSGMSAHERSLTLKAVESGSVKLLYVTPERFRKEEFREVLQKTKVSLLAVDEAHCISQWGHDFRPDYSRLGEHRQWLETPVTMALTATATAPVQKDILEQLGIGDAQVFVDGIERPNLHLAVEEVHGLDDKIRHLVGLRHQFPGPAIFYFSLISTLERVSEELERLGIKHARYHGQLPEGLRSQQQRRFMAADEDLILATPAFGLGVDKADVRLLVHVELPGSIEAYYQEVGRAGRDGKPSHCQLLYDPDDVSIQMDFIKWANPDPGFITALFNLLKDHSLRVQQEGADYLRQQLNFHNRRDFRVETALNLLERWEVIDWPHHDFRRLKVIDAIPAEQLNPGFHEQRLRRQNQKLLELVQWVSADGCRRQRIHEYFGVKGGEPCGYCDQCERVQE